MRVRYTDQSLEDLQKIEDYLLRKWNIDVFDHFLDKLYHIVDLILEGNVFFQKLDDTNYRKILITKHNTLVYKIEDEVLYIVKILQNFQDPDENLKYFDDED